MRTKSIVVASLCLACWSLGCNGDPDALCDAVEIESALAVAVPGDTVRIGSCEVLGPLRVPAGVTLEGEAGATVRAPEDSGAISLTGGSSASAIRSLTVLADGTVGVLVMGGAAEIETVEIRATRGYALVAQDLSGLELTDVSVMGPVTEANASESRFLRVIPTAPAMGPCPAGETCTCEPGETREDGGVCDASGRWAQIGVAYGIYISGGTATFSNVNVSGIASFGVVFSDANVTWSGGSVTDTLGVGIRQLGGDVMLSDVDVASTYQGLRGTPVFGIAATDAGMLRSAGLNVLDNDRYGLVTVGASGAHVDLASERNGDAGVWVGDSTSFEISGENTRLCENAFAGFVSVNSSNVSVSDGLVEGTQSSSRSVGTLGRIEVGDGIHLISSTETIRLSGLVLRNNERAGAVVDLGVGGGSGFSIADVEVTTEGTQLGAIGGSVMGPGALEPGAPPGWDSGIVRGGTAVANDSAHTTVLDAVTESGPDSVEDRRDLAGAIFPML